MLNKYINFFSDDAWRFFFQIFDVSFFYSDFFQIQFLLASKQASKKKLKITDHQKKPKRNETKIQKGMQKKIYVILSIHSQQEKKL